MERTRELILPVVGLVLIVGAAMASRWMADRRAVSRVGAGASRSGSRIEISSDPIAYRFLYPHEPWAVEGRLMFARFVNEIEGIEASGKTVRICTTPGWPSYDYEKDTLYWNPSAARYVPEDPNLDWKWFATTPLVTLAYTLSHAHYDLCRDGDCVGHEGRERFAVADENRIRHILFLKDPACSQICPRPGYRETWPDMSGNSVEQVWWDYRGAVEY